jgi:hypothetical protein
MRVTIKCALGQALLIIAFLTICQCSAKKEEAPIIPPITSPLSGDCIGYGVIIDSYTHITGEPAEGGVSLGYLRRGSLVRVLRRQIIKTANGSVSWVLADSNSQSFPLGFPSGWLKEEVMDIYDSESRAKTAAESMSQ